MFSGDNEERGSDRAVQNLSNCDWLISAEKNFINEIAMQEKVKAPTLSEVAHRKFGASMSGPSIGLAPRKKSSPLKDMDSDDSGPLDNKSRLFQAMML